MSPEPPYFSPGHAHALFIRTQGPIYYIAGPSGMVTAMTGLLNSSGVSGDDMKTEEFGDYKLYQDSAHSDQGTGTNPSDSAPGQSVLWRPCEE